jgi:hypothetical protein
VWQDSDAGRQALADRWRVREDVPELDAGDVAEQQQLTAVATTPQSAVCFGPPPSGTRDATRYWRLLRKADRVEREGNPKQAYRLRQQAKALEVPEVVDEPTPAEVVAPIADEPPADEWQMTPEVAALFADDVDDVFLPMSGVEVDSDEERALLKVAVAEVFVQHWPELPPYDRAAWDDEPDLMAATPPPALTSSRPEGPAERPHWESREWSAGMADRFRALRAGGAP